MKTRTLSLGSILFITILMAVTSCKKNPDAGCTVSGLQVVKDTIAGTHAMWTGGYGPYVIQYRPFGTHVWDSVVSLTDTAQLTWLAAYTNYEWRVKAGCTVSYSPVETFRTGGCQRGYEGSDCRSEIRTKYLGTYVGSIACPGGTPAASTVMLGASTADILSIVIADGNTRYTGTLSDSTFTFQGQLQNNGTINGTGTFAPAGTGYTLRIVYDSDIYGYNSTCTYTGSKQ